MEEKEKKQEEVKKSTEGTNNTVKETKSTEKKTNAKKNDASKQEVKKEGDKKKENSKKNPYANLGCLKRCMSTHIFRHKYAGFVLRVLCETAPPPFR